MSDCHTAVERSMAGMYLSNTEIFYNMSILLATLSLKQIDLKSPEKPILTALCIRANENGECWPSVKCLSADVGMDKKTVYAALAKLQDKKIISKTGEMKGRTKSVPVFKIHLKSLPENGSALNLSVPVCSGSLPISGSAKRTHIRVMERVSLKRKEKGVFADATSTQNPRTPSLEQIQDFNWHLNKNEKGVPQSLLWVGEWMDSN